MFPFWESVVEPVVRTSGATRIVEIGALRGENTELMLDALGPGVELHVIDPLPEFDPSEHEKRFPGRYVFHRDLSLNALPSMGYFDAALIDGDHNWYTVYNELQLLRTAARQAERPLPVLVLHDVCWPYGRRDLYYEPSQIPEEFRQPYEKRGMRPGRKRLLPGGGMNVTLHNARTEYGPRNGVMTALDDFLREHDEKYRRVVIPIYFGLAIVVEQRVLEEHPELAATLDHIESPDGKDSLLELSEQIRLEATVFEHNIGRVREEKLNRANQRYLALLRAALADEHYLENEARIEYLIDRAESGGTIDSESLRDPLSVLKKEFRRIRQARQSGDGGEPGVTTAFFPYTAMGSVRLEHLEATLDTIREERVDGDLVECCTGRGGGAVYMRGYLEAHELHDRRVYVADEFRATPAGAPVRPLTEGGVADLLADLGQVREAFARFDLLDDRVRFLQGRMSETLADAPIDAIAMLRLGAGIGADAEVALEQLYDRVATGGFVVVEDTSDEVCRSALERFRARRGLTESPERVGWSGVAWRKAAGDLEAATEETTSDTVGVGLDRAPLAPPVPEGAIDLSVVVVFYNMRREAARTLHSLSRAYQREVDGLDYEVIVVENGSAGDQKLGDSFVRSFGPEFRYVDLGEGAEPSPTSALNYGIRIARGSALALMIDGAHMLSPGVLRFGMAGLRTYEPAIVATQQWYVGPGQQPDAVDAGYDQGREDELFEAIGWPEDGYRLFEISHFIGERDWFDGIIESNCLFVPRGLLEQVGGFDESFAMPGGGYANLELYERLGSAPGVTMVSILGEGSFHQVHGGTTTNDSARDDRRRKIFAYGEHYRELRGEQLSGPAKAVHYVGNLATHNARRTRSRRMTALAFSRRRETRGPDGVPRTAEPVPEELKTAFIESYWNALAWKDVRWGGEAVGAAPTDLVVYQELVADVRPDWIVLTAQRGGGRAWFFASVCDLVGHGRVLCVTDARDARRPEHPRITYLDGSSQEPETIAEVRRVVGAERALVVIAEGGSHRVAREFRGYAPLVPIGSYVVIEDTVVNGHPVWPGHGPGPAEAVRRILSNRGDFVQDSSWERHSLTFNPGGFLRRVSEAGAGGEA